MTQIAGNQPTTNTTNLQDINSQSALLERDLYGDQNRPVNKFNEQLEATLKADAKVITRDVPGKTGISAVSVEGDTIVLPQNATRVDLMVGKLMKSAQDLHTGTQTYSEARQTVQGLKERADSVGTRTDNAALSAHAQYIEGFMHQVGRESGNKLGIIEKLYENRANLNLTAEESKQLLEDFKKVQSELNQTLCSALFVDGDSSKGLTPRLQQIDCAYQKLVGNQSNNYSNEAAKNTYAAASAIGHCDKIMEQTNGWYAKHGAVLPKP